MLDICSSLNKYLFSLLYFQPKNFYRTQDSKKQIRKVSLFLYCIRARFEHFWVEWKWLFDFVWVPEKQEQQNMICMLKPACARIVPNNCYYHILSEVCFFRDLTLPFWEFPMLPHRLNLSYPKGMLPGKNRKHSFHTQEYKSWLQIKEDVRCNNVDT